MKQKNQQQSLISAVTTHLLSSEIPFLLFLKCYYHICYLYKVAGPYSTELYLSTGFESARHLRGSVPISDTINAVKSKKRTGQIYLCINILV